MRPARSKRIGTQRQERQRGSADARRDRFETLETRGNSTSGGRWRQQGYTADAGERHRSRVS